MCKEGETTACPITTPSGDCLDLKKLGPLRKSQQIRKQFIGLQKLSPTQTNLTSGSASFLKNLCRVEIWGKSELQSSPKLSKGLEMEIDFGMSPSTLGSRFNKFNKQHSEISS